MHKQSGFTIIELLIIIVVLALASVVFFIQKNNIEITARDEQRKTAINAMHYGLEEIYYKEHDAYPRTLDKDTLPFVDPAAFSDPHGIELGQTTATVDGEEYPVTSDYTYEGTNCVDETCKSYTLRATLEREDEFERKSRNN